MRAKLAVKEWAKGKNPMFVFLAISYAQFARESCEALRHIKERRIYGHPFPLPDLPSWFAMYQSRKPLLAYKRLIVNSSDFADEVIDLFGGLRMLDKSLKRDSDQVIPLTITPEMREMALEYWQEMCSMIFAGIEEEIAETSLPPDLQEKLHNALIKDELPLGFYFLVYAPCISFYGTSPNDLYRKALKRDTSALDKLLRIDPLIVHDPAIGFQIQSVRLNGKIHEYERLLEAILKNPAINYKDIADERRSVKSAYGAKIYELAKALNLHLKASQIRGLYDALAHDFEGTINDTDIRKPDSFDKSLKEKSAWQNKHQKPEKQK